jgi:hypothetical protein
VELDEETVSVHRTKEEIENAPELDENSYRDAWLSRASRQLRRPGATGYRDW